VVAMCMPKAPKPDPSIKEAQRKQEQLELERLAEEKKKQTQIARRTSGKSGARSLIGGGMNGFGGYGGSVGNYSDSV